MGRTFNGMVRIIARLDVHDSQCGFKAFSGDVARLLFALSEVDGFAFDPEVLVMARILGYRVTEVPVDWTTVDGSSVRPVRDSLLTGLALVRIVVRRRPAAVREAARALGLEPRRRGDGRVTERSGVCEDWTARLRRPPRVVFVAWRDLDHPQAGGSEFVIDRLAAGLVERGYDVTLARRRPDERARRTRPGPLGGTYDAVPAGARWSSTPGCTTPTS